VAVQWRLTFEQIPEGSERTNGNDIIDQFLNFILKNHFSNMQSPVKTMLLFQCLLLQVVRVKDKGYENVSRDHSMIRLFEVPRDSGSYLLATNR
jgi:hypothetical protein